MTCIYFTRLFWWPGVWTWQHPPNSQWHTSYYTPPPFSMFERQQRTCLRCSSSASNSSFFFYGGFLRVSLRQEQQALCLDRCPLLTLRSFSHKLIVSACCLRGVWRFRLHTPVGLAKASLICSYTAPTHPSGTTSLWNHFLICIQPECERKHDDNACGIQKRVCSAPSQSAYFDLFKSKQMTSLPKPICTQLLLPHSEFFIKSEKNNIKLN